MRLKRLHAEGGGIDGGRIHAGDGLGQSAGVVHFGMVGNDHVDLRGVDDGGDAFHHLAEERSLDRVDERDLLIHDEEGVIGGTAAGGVAVELLELPVDGADPPDIGGNPDRFHHNCTCVLS